MRTVEIMVDGRTCYVAMGLCQTGCTVVIRAELWMEDSELDWRNKESI